jgi:hypothetical protein
VLLIAQGDPRVEPACGGNAVLGRLRSTPSLASSAAKKAVVKSWTGLPDRAPPPSSSFLPFRTRPRRGAPPRSPLLLFVLLLTSKGVSMAGSPSFLPADIASDRSPRHSHELHGSGVSTPLPQHPDLWWDKVVHLLFSRLQSALVLVPLICEHG